ncbi:MAG TPA: DUF3108 domain-containing protein [Deltaproteobacteria bacterium]|nr:DUF3108 domain-containing protein [Deltaproteobacteria bacterium]
MVAADITKLPDQALLQTAYSGGESFRYTVSWMGVKAGELLMEIEKKEDKLDAYLIKITAKSTGLLGVFYPVNDYFETEVAGTSRLPATHLMIQNEGTRRNKKVTLYDQSNFKVSYCKNEDPPKEYFLNGPVHNEFSSFFFMRTLPFAQNDETMVPTFADGKRHEVPVFMEGREMLRTIFGKKETIMVRPRLNFKGLYDKMGDPLVWFTEDDFRIPVKIKAKIVIGSLTTSLVDYHGPVGSPVMEEQPKYIEKEDPL